MSVKKLSLFLFFTLFLFQCKKGNNQSSYSDFFTPVYVDFYINLDLPSYADLNFPNGYVYEAGRGYKNRGIIVYNNGFGGSDQFVAFDRSCPVNVDSSCSYVSVDSSTLYFKCGQYTGVGGKFVPCCGSKFTANNGANVSGPATRGLKQYYVYNLGRQLHVVSTAQ